jgi:hypothetical protein
MWAQNIELFLALRVAELDKFCIKALMLIAYGLR